MSQISQVKAVASDIPASAAAAEVQRHGAEVASRINDIMARAGRNFWQCQGDLLRIQTEEAMRALTALKPGQDPSLTVTDYCTHCHDGAERMIGSLRVFNDQARQIGWELFSLYTENLANLAPKAPAPNGKA